MLLLSPLPDRLALCAAAAVAALFGATAIALEVTWIPGWRGIDAIAVLPAPSDAEVHAGPRCARCGWIESKRDVLSNTVEYTVRMGDGSSTVFEEALPTRWRLGERLSVM
ncbi:MAG TPA: hypothetical protein VNC62_03945 [Burkholderiales bacterium]|nr:hypothetical protein [Burkholderiales bacterium]